MTTNDASNVEDTDMAECEGEKVVTMMDVLQEEQDFEDDANAVLGASDEKNCTYAKGYIKRQAIYACLTCCSEAKVDPTKRAGLCLACSLNCHENHDLVELYTKRNFRCDCGNPKFNSHPCQFTPNKPDLNEDNTYNQNFGGLYCTCQRPYPDPESTVEDDEMIQCIICEDWLHASHLEATVPGVDQYAEMVCKDCMENNDFLHDYNHLIVNNETEDVDVTGINGNDTTLANGDLNVMSIEDSMHAVQKTESINVIENPSDNIDVDDAQNEKTLTENDDIATESKESLNKESSEVSMDTDPENVDTSQIPSAPTTESPENIIEVASEEKTESKENLLEGTKEESTMKSEDKIEVPTKLDDASAAEGSAKPKDTSQENDVTEKIEENTEQHIELQHPEKCPEIPENKDDVEAESKLDEAVTSTNKKGDEPTSNEISNREDTSTIKETNNTEATLDEAVTSTNKKEDEPTSNDSNEISNGEDTSTIKETNNTEPTSAETGEIDRTESEKTTESNLPKQDDESNTDITEKETLQSEAKSEIDTSKTESNNLNDDEAMKENVDMPPEHSEYTVENETEVIKDNKRKLSTEDSPETKEQMSKKPKINEENNCIRPKGVKKMHKGATFWPSNFRQKLCTCSECLSMYKDLSVLFLIDAEDTVFAYEALGKERVDGRTTQYEKGLEALSSLDRIQQINALTEYNKMKDKLLDFLKSFKDRKEVVKEEDIKAFFAGMKPKREPDGVYFCR